MNLRVIRRAALTVAAASLAIAAGASPAAAATPPTFDVRLGDQCTTVSGTPTASGTVSQLTSTGAVLQTVNVAFGGDGTDQACFDDTFHPGMKIRGTAEGITRTFSIPYVSLAVDRTTDVIRGRTRAGTQVKVTIDHRSKFTLGTEYTYNRTPSSTGTWSVDTTSKFNLVGGDSIHVEVTSGPDHVDWWTAVPQLTVRINSSRVEALMLPGQAGNVVLRTGSGTLRGKASFAGSFDIEVNARNWFVNSYGTQVPARVGDTVSAPFQPSMAFTIPNLTVAVNSATDVVSGSCSANRRMLVGVHTGMMVTLIEAACSAAGTYSVDTTATEDIQPGMRIVVSLKRTSGDVVERVKIAG